MNLDIYYQQCLNKTFENERRIKTTIIAFRGIPKNIEKGIGKLEI